LYHVVPAGGQALDRGLVLRPMFGERQLSRLSSHRGRLTLIRAQSARPISGDRLRSPVGRCVTGSQVSVWGRLTGRYLSVWKTSFRAEMSVSQISLRGETVRPIPGEP
jgi:hypothetical protein